MLSFTPGAHPPTLPLPYSPLSPLNLACTTLCTIFLTLAQIPLIFLSADTWALFFLFERASCEGDSHLPSQLWGWQLASKAGVEHKQYLPELWCPQGSLAPGLAEQSPGTGAERQHPNALSQLSAASRARLCPTTHALSNASSELLHAPFSCQVDKFQGWKEQKREQSFLTITPA